MATLRGRYAVEVRERASREITIAITSTEP
jgi:hypothetical protein